MGRLKARNSVQAAAKAKIATKAVAYVRVSTEEQAATGFGLEAQDRAVRAFAESQGYELVAVITDPGVSGATRPAERPGYAQILELAEAGSFSVLLVYKFDRLARQIVYAVTAVNDLAERFGAMIRSVTEPIDTATPMGRTLFAILAGMAENERDVIRERTTGGKIQKATRGGYAGGRVPYGYECDREGGLRLVEDQARIVRRIIRARRQRPQKTLTAIAGELNAEGVKPPKGKAWRPGTVAYIADNPKYRGAVEYLFGETHVLSEGVHEAVL